MQRIISGLTATGELTLGNYLGSLKNIIAAQTDYDVYMFVADLHAITLPIEPSILKANIRKQLATYLSCGIDVQRTKLFKQSEIIGHTEMFYYLTTISNEGQLKRMTQYKDKLIKNDNNTEQVPMGLLMYPILMAADILLYNVNGVIVGQDQKQHLELTRDLADRLNFKYQLGFNLPEPMIAEHGAKIMALRTPTKKMSKSDKDKNETIFLLDDLELIRKKIMSSLTDSDNEVRYDVKNKPGISNLITIYSVINEITIEKTVEELGNLDYKSFKEIVANSVIGLLKPIQDKYYSLTDQDIESALAINRERVQIEAKKNVNKIAKAIGMR